MTKDNSDKNNSKLWVLVVFLLAIIAVMGYFLMQGNEKVDDLSSEKQQLTAQLEELVAEYDDLELANDSLMNIADIERARLRSMIDSVQSLRSGDLKKLDRYKNEVYKLKVENKKLVNRLDSMSVHIENLVVEKEAVEMNLQQEQQKSAQLGQVKQLLEGEVAKGSILQLSGISSIGIKRWNSGKESETSKARRADEIKVCFTLGKNLIAPKGERIVYVRLITPENTVVSLSDSASSNTFTSNGKAMLYSNKKAVWYEGEAVETCLFISREEFTKGEYKAEVYTEDYLLGTSTVKLN
jgi:cell division protein FtsB